MARHDPRDQKQRIPNPDAYRRHSRLPLDCSTLGNKGANALRRIEGDTAHFLMVTFWEPEAAIRRGGGEYGEDWHLAGKLLRKPNTWKDFIACAQYLIEKKYTSTPHLAIEGGSMGGITIGRSITELLHNSRLAN